MTIWSIDFVLFINNIFVSIFNLAMLKKVQNSGYKKWLVNFQVPLLIANL